MLNEIKRCMASFLIIISSLLYTLCIHATVPYEQLKEWHIRSLSEQTPDHKRKLFAATYDILAKKEKREQASHPTFDQAFYKEMELFVGDGKRADANIMANIDRTESVAGSIMLRKMASILSANTDPDTFTARQSFVRQLVENQQLFDRVATLCTQYAQSEEIFLSNWDNTGIHQKDLNKHYYTWFPSLNNSPTALTLGEYERFIEANVFPAMAVGVTALTLVRLGYYSNFDSSDFWDAISKTSCALPNNCLHYANPQNTYNFLKKA